MLKYKYKLTHITAVFRDNQVELRFIRKIPFNFYVNVYTISFETYLTHCHIRFFNSFGKPESKVLMSNAFFYRWEIKT